MASCREERGGRRLRVVKLLLENLPPSLAPQRETLARCLEAMNRALPLREVWLFGSHARGEARPDSDVDLCLVAEGEERQLKAVQKFSEAIWDIWPCPPFTLLPIAAGAARGEESVRRFLLRHRARRGGAPCHGKLMRTIPPTGFGLQRQSSKR
jgi:predicted nucleotidyltransferase